MKLSYLLHILSAVIYNFSIKVSAKCPSDALNSFPFVLEYAVWRGWSQVLIFTSQLEPGCLWAVVRLIKCLAVNRIATAMDIEIEPNLNLKLGVIIMLPQLNTNATEEFKEKVKKLNHLKINAPWFDWLVTARSYQEFKYVNKALNETAILYDQNIVVAYPDISQKRHERLDLCDTNFIYKRKRKILRNKSKFTLKRYGNKRNETEVKHGYYHSTERFKNLKVNITYRNRNYEVPLFASGSLSYNYSKSFHMVNISHLKEDVLYSTRTKYKNRNTSSMYLFQYFKVRVNSTLYGTFLGVWSSKSSMSLVDAPHPVEARKFMGEELILGRCNLTQDRIGNAEEDFSLSPPLLDDVLYFLMVRFNASFTVRYYNKLGYRTYEGSWTGLLGALIDHNVDIAFELVTSHTSQHQDMDFIFPIAETMFNIYIRDHETSAVRDIFLAPFSPRLLGCVAVIILAFAIAILLISRFAPYSNEWHMAFTESFLWSTGILCQQGGTNTPTNPAGSVLLIVCLLFALVTYNSYAAFITSVLSVRVASVDTVAAVLQSSNLKIGYIKNGPDQIYLMSTKDAQLNAFYIRGYSEAENLVTSSEEGLMRAAKYDYAFFSEQRSARITLRSLSQEHGRCTLRELSVPSTRAHLAFPMQRGSPYARPVLVSLLQLRSAGVLARLQNMLVPGMPKCTPLPRFASAKAADVRTALVLFLIGIISATIIGLVEYLWNKRRQLQDSIIRYYTRFRSVFD